MFTSTPVTTLPRSVQRSPAPLPAPRDDIQSKPSEHSIVFSRSSPINEQFHQRLVIPNDSVVKNLSKPVIHTSFGVVRSSPYLQSPLPFARPIPVRNMQPPPMPVSSITPVKHLPLVGTDNTIAPPRFQNPFPKSVSPLNMSLNRANDTQQVARVDYPYTRDDAEKTNSKNKDQAVNKTSNWSAIWNVQNPTPRNTLPINSVYRPAFQSKPEMGAKREQPVCMTSTRVSVSDGNQRVEFQNRQVMRVSPNLNKENASGTRSPLSITRNMSAIPFEPLRSLSSYNTPRLPLADIKVNINTNAGLNPNVNRQNLVRNRTFEADVKSKKYPVVQDTQGNGHNQRSRLGQEDRRESSGSSWTENEKKWVEQCPVSNENPTLSPSSETSTGKAEPTLLNLLHVSIQIRNH